MKKVLGVVALFIMSLGLLWAISYSMKTYLHQMDERTKAQELAKSTTAQELPEPTTEETVDDTQQKIETIVSKSDRIDSEFALWLFEHYEEAFHYVVAAAQTGEYDDLLWYKETGKSLFVLRDEMLGHLDSDMTMREHLIYPKDCTSKEAVSLYFAGDVSFANDYLPGQIYTNQGIDGAFSKDVQERMKEADVFMLNNEFCYSTGGTPQTAKKYYFRAEPARVARLDEMGVDIVSIANNHAFDYGEEAFLDTMQTLNDANIPYVGGGSNLEDAKEHIVYFIANGMKIGYIGATQIERETLFTQPATENSAGVVRCYEPELVCEMIRSAKEQCDFVVVYPHWGTEKVARFEPDQQQLAYAFIDAGADAIVGSHPHCLQGVEYYHGVPIFYSLGNFSFSSSVRDSVILHLDVTMEGIRQARFIPCMENAGQTIQCEIGGDSYKRILHHLNDISANASISEDGVVTEN